MGEYTESRLLDSGDALVPTIGSYIKKLVKGNSSINNSGARRDEPELRTVFHAQRIPPISIEDYLARIAKYSLCSKSCFVVAALYIKRITEPHGCSTDGVAQPRVVLTHHTVHRLLLTAIMLSAKFLDDTYYNNAYYAKVGGLPLSELNSLELHFLAMIRFNLSITPEVYELMENEIMADVLCSDAPDVRSGREALLNAGFNQSEVLEKLRFSQQQQQVIET
mmetsp:Transcript_20065/g.34548  ORF Transcript_20065/g.34548 Transcript_20065/m.34548 type:complete len:222 (+) Transcript_20065:318-983(+)